MHRTVSGIPELNSLISKTWGWHNCWATYAEGMGNLITEFWFTYWFILIGEPLDLVIGKKYLKFQISLVKYLYFYMSKKFQTLCQVAYYILVWCRLLWYAIAMIVMSQSVCVRWSTDTKQVESCTSREEYLEIEGKYSCRIEDWMRILLPRSIQVVSVVCDTWQILGILEAAPLIPLPIVRYSSVSVWYSTLDLNLKQCPFLDFIKEQFSLASNAFIKRTKPCFLIFCVWLELIFFLPKKSRSRNCESGRV